MAENNFFEHTGSDGSDVAFRVERTGYNYQTAGENLAIGVNTIDGAMAGWIKSPGHCATLMGSQYQDFALATDGNLWVAVFGKTF